MLAAFPGAMLGALTISILLLSSVADAFRLASPFTVKAARVVTAADMDRWRSPLLHRVRSSRGNSEASSPKEFFRLARGKMEFGTVDEVELLLWDEPALIRRYLTESPDRVLLATWDAELVDRRARDVFRLTTKPMSFVHLSLQPSIDVRLTAIPPEAGREEGAPESGGHLLSVESLGHSMNGLEQILGQRFAESLRIDVTGKLRAHVPPARPGDSKGRGPVRLVGEVVFVTSGQLPSLLSLTPRPVLESAAIAINRRIMSYAKGKFVKNLAKDFNRWSASALEAG
ncbi:Protein of unknown function DUF1997 [Nannochloropsis gaditana]|uniref:Uncharacterized protein n=1 Tax=Nannochloropsis gaditana TaxID=72520 RepID=W7U0S3_9STRA|nr:Protein of unknown function DUF1997 [Nannochloropsis gaditana]